MTEKSKFIDLHIHTKNSDGTFTTQQLLDKLEGMHAKIISFTDHDSVGSYYDILEGRAKVPEGMDVITGVELTCKDDGCRKDILGYGIDIDIINEYLKPFKDKDYKLKKQQFLLNQFKEKCSKLGLYFSEDIEVKTGEKAEAYHLLRNDLQKYPENIRVIPDIANDETFYWRHYSNQASPLFVDESYDNPTFSEAIELIHRAGGLAFLAHPFLYSAEDEKVKRLVKRAVEAGIDGVELHHSTNKEGYINKLRAIASQYNLLYSGGSDFHGTTIPNLKLITGYDNMMVDFNDITWLNQIKMFKKG